MRHLRTDYDTIQPWPVKRPHIARWNQDGGEVVEHVTEADVPFIKPLIPDDEPVFLLRGQDPAAAHAVRCYVGSWLHEGGDLAVAQRLFEWADEMEAYAKRAQHGPPDVPPEALLPSESA